MLKVSEHSKDDVSDDRRRGNWRDKHC